MRKFFYLAGITMYFTALTAETQNYKQTDNGIRAEVNNIDIEIQYYSPEIVRILKSPEGNTCNKESLSVIKQPEKINFVVTVRNGNDFVKLASKAVEVQLNTKTGKVASGDINRSKICA